MNKIYFISVILFVMVLLIGLFNSELRLTEGYLFVLVLSVFNMLIWIVNEVRNEIKN
jgi:uncharacterized membrane protein YiaA